MILKPEYETTKDVRVIKDPFIIIQFTVVRCTSPVLIKCQGLIPKLLNVRVLILANAI